MDMVVQGLENIPELRSTRRRWSVIVMMDVVGFTTLTEQDESGTLRRWESWWNTCIAPAISRHGGEVFRRYGDGVLVEFGGAPEAVACVLEVQRSFAGH